MMQFKAALPKIPPILYLLGIGGVMGFSLNAPNWLDRQPDSLANRRSLGQISFSQANASEAERQGIQAFADGNYNTASTYFTFASKASPSDPIPLIYGENARWINQKPLHVAAMVPLGSNREVALEMLRGLAMAQQDYNRGPNKVVIEIFNDENDPELAKTIAQQIVKDASIKAVIGPNASNAALHAGPIFNAAGVVMITPTSFANQLSGLGEYIFRTTPKIRHLTDTLAHYSVHQVRRKKVAVCYDSDAADNLSFKDEFIAALLEQGGTHIPTDCDFSSPAFDAKDMVARLISDGADAVLLTPHIDRLDRLIDLSRENKWRMVLMGSPSLQTRKILEIGQGDLNGVVIPVPYHAEMPTAQAFAKEVKAQFEVVPTWRTFASMDALSAILKVGQHSTRRPQFQQRLRSANFKMSGSAEDVRFLPSGDRIGNGVLVQIRPAAKGYHFRLISSK